MKPIALVDVLLYESTTMKAEEMGEFGKLVFKLAVLHDIFEVKDLAARLRSETEWNYKDATLGLYLKDKRTPPREFPDQVRRALKLGDSAYGLLLFVYGKTTGRLSPQQKQQTELFEEMLRLDAARRFLKNGDGGAKN